MTIKHYDLRNKILNLMPNITEALSAIMGRIAALCDEGVAKMFYVYPTDNKPYHSAFHRPVIIRVEFPQEGCCTFLGDHQLKNIYFMEEMDLDEKHAERFAEIAADLYVLNLFFAGFMPSRRDGSTYGPGLLLLKEANDPAVKDLNVLPDYVEMEAFNAARFGNATSEASNQASPIPEVKVTKTEDQLIEIAEDIYQSFEFHAEVQDQDGWAYSTPFVDRASFNRIVYAAGTGDEGSVRVSFTVTLALDGRVIDASALLMSNGDSCGRRNDGFATVPAPAEGV